MICLSGREDRDVRQPEEELLDGIGRDGQARSPGLVVVLVVAVVVFVLAVMRALAWVFRSRAISDGGYRNAGAGPCVATDTARLVGRAAASARRTGRRRRIAMILALRISRMALRSRSRPVQLGTPACRAPLAVRSEVNPELAGGEARRVGFDHVAERCVLRPTVGGNTRIVWPTAGFWRFALEVTSLAKYHFGRGFR